MKTAMQQIAKSTIVAVACAMLAACTIDGIRFLDTRSGEMMDGDVHVEPCKTIGGTTIETTVVECKVGDVDATFTGPAGLLTGLVIDAMFDPLILELPASASTPTGFL